MRSLAAMRVTVLVLCLAPGWLQAQTGWFLHPMSAAPGETVGAYVATPARSYHVDVYDSHGFGNRTLLMQSPTFPSNPQPTVVGSFARAAPDPAFDITAEITLEVWVQPTLLIDGVGLIGKSGYPGQLAYNLSVDGGSKVSFHLSDSLQWQSGNNLFSKRSLWLNQWTHVVATYDGEFKRIYLNGVLDAEVRRTGPIVVNNQPVRVAAYTAGGSIDGHCLDGALDSPAIYDRALTEVEVLQRYQERAFYGPSSPGVLPGCVAQWNFDEMEGEVLADATGNGHSLQLINNATRAVPGPADNGLRPTPEIPAIRFASDDQFNPEWNADFEFTIPASFAPGFYEVELMLSDGWTAGVYPLIVRPRPGEERDLAVIASSNTWAAYNSWGAPGGGALYSRHVDGTLRYYVGMRQPSDTNRLNAHGPGSGYSHLVDAERYLWEWLQREGRPFDLYTDHDLHSDPDLLSRYRVAVIAGHSEYWTEEMIDHLEVFLDGGGSFVNLSGNTMWARVSFDATGAIMEGRKYPHTAGAIPPGERLHSTAGNPLGGLWHCIGRPEAAVLGTMFDLMGSAQGEFEVLDGGHWAFADTGVTTGSRFGSNVQNGAGIIGHEADSVDPRFSPPGIERIATGVLLNIQTVKLNASCTARIYGTTGVGGDMTFYRHAGGGGVFSAATIAYSSALAVDPVAAQVLRNVLDRFEGRQLARCVQRTGSGINPLEFACTTLPRLGTSWTTSIATSPLTQDTLLLLAAQPAQLPLFGGELLVAVVPPPLVQRALGNHVVPIPNLPALLGARAHAQGLRIDGVGPTTRLTMLNAQQLTFGY